MYNPLQTLLFNFAHPLQDAILFSSTKTMPNYLDIPRTNAAVAAELRQFANAAVAATLRVKQTARSALRSGTRIGSTRYSKDR
jgi:hypothetical protein